MQMVAEGVSEWAELTVIGPTGCGKYCPPDVKVREAPPSLLGFMIIGLWHALKACKKGRFDMLLAGSGLTAPILLLARKISKTPSAVFIHGLDIVVDNFLYQKIFVPAVKKADLVIANSGNTRELAIASGVSPERITVINPGTSLPDLDNIESRESFCQRHAIPFEKIILFVGRMTRRKGLSAFITHSLPDILKAMPGTGLVVVGNNPNQGLTNHGEQEQVLEAVKSLELQNHVQFLGAVDDQNLIAAYAAADVQVFPLVDVPGDVEGFGMVAIEAAACGTPTVAFAAGGVSDAISADNGILVPAGDYQRLSQSLLATISGQVPGGEDCINHAKRFSWARFNKQLKAALVSVHSTQVLGSK